MRTPSQYFHCFDGGGNSTRLPLLLPLSGGLREPPEEGIALHIACHTFDKPGTPFAEKGYPDSRHDMPAGLTATQNGSVDYAAISGDRLFTFFTLGEGGYFSNGIVATSRR